VETVVGGVTQTVPKVYTQTFGAGTSAPAVMTGTIGLGTLTGRVGVVKTGDAKSGGVAVGRGRGMLGEMVLVLGVAGMAALGGGVWGVVRL